MAITTTTIVQAIKQTSEQGKLFVVCSLAIWILSFSSGGGLSFQSERNEQ